MTRRGCQRFGGHPKSGESLARRLGRHPGGVGNQCRVCGSEEVRSEDPNWSWERGARSKPCPKAAVGAQRWGELLRAPPQGAGACSQGRPRRDRCALAEAHLGSWIVGVQLRRGLQARFVGGADPGTSVPANRTRASVGRILEALARPRGALTGGQLSGWRPRRPDVSPTWSAAESGSLAPEA